MERGRPRHRCNSVRVAFDLSGGNGDYLGPNSPKPPTVLSTHTNLETSRACARAHYRVGAPMPTLHEAEYPRPQTDRDRALDDQRVMTIAQWCEVNGFSPWTGKRLIKAGKGPKITQISDRRIGITVANNRRWQQARERA